MANARMPDAEGPPPGDEASPGPPPRNRAAAPDHQERPRPRLPHMMIVPASAVAVRAVPGAVGRTWERPRDQHSHGPEVRHRAAERSAPRRQRTAAQPRLPGQSLPNTLQRNGERASHARAAQESKSPRRGPLVVGWWGPSARAPREEAHSPAMGPAASGRAEAPRPAIPGRHGWHFDKLYYRKHTAGQRLAATPYPKPRRNHKGWCLKATSASYSRLDQVDRMPSQTSGSRRPGAGPGPDEGGSAAQAAGGGEGHRFPRGGGPASMGPPPHPCTRTHSLRAIAVKGSRALLGLFPGS